MVPAPTTNRPLTRSATKQRRVKHQRNTVKVVDTFECGICLEGAKTCRKKRVQSPAKESISSIMLA